MACALSRDQRSLRCVNWQSDNLRRGGRYIAELRNALGYSIRAARRKIVEVAKQWMQDAKQGALSLASEHLAQRAKTHGVAAAHAQESWRCQMRTRAKRGGQHEVIGNQKR